MGRIVFYICVFIIYILQAIKVLFTAWLESFQLDMYLLDAMYEEKKVKLSVILSMLGTIPLLLASVFVAGTGLGFPGGVSVRFHSTQ